MDFFTFAPHRAGDFVRPHADAIVADIVFKILLLLGHRIHDQLTHRPAVARKQFIHCRIKNVVAKTIRDFDAAFFRRSTSRNDRIEVTEIPMRQAAVMQDQFENILLQLTFFIDFYRWNDDSLFKNIGGVSRQAAGHFPAHIRHMTKHR